MLHPQLQHKMNSRSPASRKKRLVAIVVLAVFSVCAIATYLMTPEPTSSFAATGPAESEEIGTEESFFKQPEKAPPLTGTPFTDSQVSTPRLLLSLFAVFVLIAVAVPLLRRFLDRSQRGSTNGRLQVVETLPLGRQQYVCLLGAPGKTLLLGVCDGSIEVLSEIDSPDEPVPTAELAAAPKASRERFSRMLDTAARRQHESTASQTGE